MVDNILGGGKPHPAYLRPGPQPHNQIAPTALEQLSRAKTPKSFRPYSSAVVRRLAATVAGDEALRAALVHHENVASIVKQQVAAAVADCDRRHAQDLHDVRAEVVEALKALQRRRTT
jgi:hypothetical protein